MVSAEKQVMYETMQKYLQMCICIYTILYVVLWSLDNAWNIYSCDTHEIQGKSRELLGIS